MPKQIADLVQSECHAPPNLRTVLVGGDPLDSDLYEKAKNLGWPISLSYAMSEAASTISLDGRLLPHLQAKLVQGRLAFKGPSLLSGLIDEERGFHDPKVDGWFVSDDCGEISGNILRLFGRMSDL